MKKRTPPVNPLAQAMAAPLPKTVVVSAVAATSDGATSTPGTEATAPVVEPVPQTPPQTSPRQDRAAFADALRAIGAGDLATGLRLSAVALASDPDWLDAKDLHANMLARHNRHHEALKLWLECREAGMNTPGVHNNIGCTYNKLKNYREADLSYRRALERDPNHLDTLQNQSVMLHELGNFDEAIKVSQRIVQLDPNHRPALFNIASAHERAMRFEECDPHYRALLARFPDTMGAIANLVFIQHYRAGPTTEDIFQLTCTLGDRYQQAVAVTPSTDWAVAADPDKRLRIGLVSNDLHDHVVGFFIEGLLAQPLSTQVDWVAYYNNVTPTALTARIRPRFAQWRDVSLLKDADLARTIREDRIDVLIDLSGHTAGGRLGAFVHRPSPLQLTWLGYFATTGLDCFDGVIADPHCVPPGEERWFRERVLRLPHTRFCFTPPTDAPPVSPLPSLQGDRFTFGCFQHMAKINDEVMTLWSRVLREVPGARIRIQSPHLNHRVLGAQFCQRLFRHGLTSDRVVLAGSVPRMEYLGSYAEVDLALDTFPYPGGTTTTEGLWMGVPTVTLARPGMLGRQGEGLMTAAGLPQFVADSPEAYIEKALYWADPANRDLLARLRSDLRAHVSTQPLFDHARFAHDWHALIRQAWRERCTRPWQGGAAAIATAAPAVVTATPASVTVVPAPNVVVPAQDFQAQFQQALALLNAGQTAQAVEAAQALHQAFPDDARGMELLAVVFSRVQRHEEAAALLERCLQQHPGHAGLVANLRMCCLQLARDHAGDAVPHKALHWYNRALQLQPEDADQLAARSGVLIRLMRFEEALADADKALALQPQHRIAMFHRASALDRSLRIEEAIEAYRAVLQAHPQTSEALANLLYTMHFRMPQDPEAIAHEARTQVALVSGNAEAPAVDAWPVTPDASRRLRIGLVSGDLRDHPVGLFIEGLLQQPLSRQADFIAYHNHPRPTALTERIRPAFALWRDVTAMDDAALAAQVRADRVDVLIDLSGHTRWNRVGVFAHRPSPLQLTWLGYFGTTGLACFDGVIADPVCVPPGEEAWFTERVVRLPHTRLCFTPSPDMPAVAPLPALRNRHVTFGCFQHMGKINDAVLGAWGRIAARVPDARFLIRNAQLSNAPLAGRFAERLQAQGIARDRVDLGGHLPRERYLQMYSGVDLLLDTFAYPGGTTTSEGLWMGVPTIALAQPGMLGRQGEQLLSAAGMRQWITRDIDAYVEKAVHCADPAQRDALAELRAGMREHVARTPLFDQPRFAQDWHALIRALWRERCLRRWDVGEA